MSRDIHVGSAFKPHTPYHLIIIRNKVLSLSQIQCQEIYHYHVGSAFRPHTPYYLIIIRNKVLSLLQIQCLMPFSDLRLKLCHLEEPVRSRVTIVGDHIPK